MSGSEYQAALASQPNNVYEDGGPGWGLTHACCTVGSTCTPTGTCAIGPMQAGSWFWNSTAATLYVWLADGSNPASHEIEAATRVYGMRMVADAGEKSDVAVDGITFERTGGYGIYIYSNAAGGVGLSGIEIRNNTVQQTGTGTVDGGSYYNGIHFSEAVELATAPKFSGNTISYSGGHGNGINCQNADEAQIIGNHADHFNHHGFDMKSSASVLVRGNVAHDSAEANGIYQEYSANGLIEQNIIYDLSGSVAGRGSGIQIDVGSTGAQIYNNSIYNVLTGIYLINAATVENNIVVDALSSVLEAQNGGSINYNDWGLAPTIYDYGTAYDFSQWLALGGHSDDLAVDPLWVNPAAANFALQTDSPCIDAGTYVGLPYNGAAPDLGAIESP